MEVWLAWFELDWLLDILRYILNQDFRSTTRQQVFADRIELKRLHGYASMNLGGRDAALASQFL